ANTQCARLASAAGRSFHDRRPCFGLGAAAHETVPERVTRPRSCRNCLKTYARPGMQRGAAGTAADGVMIGMAAVTTEASLRDSTYALVRRLLRDEALGYWPRYAVAFALMGVAAAATALTAYLLGTMTNEAYVNHN